MILVVSNNAYQQSQSSLLTLERDNTYTNDCPTVVSNHDVYIAAELIDPVFKVKRLHR